MNKAQRRRTRAASRAADQEGVFIAPSVNRALRKLAEEMASPEGGDTEMQRLFFADGCEAKEKNHG